MPSISVATLVFESKRKVFGSQIGGIKETQEIIAADALEVDKVFRNVTDGKVNFYTSPRRARRGK